MARTLALIALLLVAAGCGGGHKARPAQPSGAPGAPARVGSGPSDFAGVYADDVFFGDASYKRAAAAQLRAAGVGIVRQPFAWSDFEKSPAPYDAFVGALARQGIHVLPMVLGPQPGGAPAGQGAMEPPGSVAAYARYAVALVRRYGPKGSFWRSNPGIPRVPIRSWQIWNEPNIPAFWGGKPDPGAYARLLAAAAPAIRKADPGAEIVAAGLPFSHLGPPAPAFLHAVYAAGAKGTFDTVAVHAYARTPAAVISRARSVRRVIAAHGDDAKLWITEFGWGTGGKPGPLTVTPPRQASYLSETLTLIGKDRAALGLRGAVVFQWRDPKPYPGRREIWPFYAGLLDVDGKPKPGLAAFMKAAKGLAATG
jgi:hypothetical protein